MVGQVCKRITFAGFFLLFLDAKQLMLRVYLLPSFTILLLLLVEVPSAASLCLLFCRIRRLTNEQNFPFSYKTCKFSQLFDLEMSLKQIFCSISLARCSDMCVFELRILLAACCAFFSRVSLRRI